MLMKSNNKKMIVSSSHHQKNNSEDRLDFKLAFKIFIKYLSFYRLTILIAFLLSLVSTTFNIIVIIGMGDLQTYFSTLVASGSSEVTLTLDTYLIFSALMLLSYFLNSFFQWIMNLVVIKLSQGIGYKMRMDLFNKVQILSVKYFDTHESGDIMSVLTNDVYNLVQFISQNFTQTLYGLTTMLGMLILMFIISPILALIVMVILCVLLSLISILIRKSGPAFMRQQRELGKMNGYIEETISGQNIINLFSQQKNVQGSFEKINNKLVKSGETSQGISGLLIPWLNFLMNFVVALLYGIGATFAALNISFYGADASVTLYPEVSDRLTNLLMAVSPERSEIVTKLSLLTSMVLATRNFIQPINQMIAMVAQMQQAVAGCKRTEEIFEQKSEYREEETLVIDKPLKGKVEIKNLNFSYIPEKPVLKNVCINAEPGQTVAIVGPTGSGKTTIINLLTKFYDIEDGDIFIDGYDIKKITKESMRKQVSIVLQDTYLFSGTILENIRLAKPDATDEEIQEAAKASDCDDFIMKLENGYNTVLSENASELSSGQKQLIAIARAMISPSSILILDEATSNIDTRTEKVVQKAMFKLIKNKTAFVIAHRLSTIRSADKIVVLKDGSVLETGNHKELMKKKGFYYNLNLSKTDNLDEEKD
ncbi:MAG: ABC transporter ATP-binding protein/permease [Malacoplasma sp.]|nr:ABC transporter ATP-binding protein/permease [Malacoplasma sp.]MDE6894277.1 ABC transporter ATP-binding protein/permease [Malacoplasma sp.]